MARILGGFSSQTQTQTGTGGVKFNPAQGSDNVMRNGVSNSITTKHQCITAMKEYEAKSFEELRAEDYAAGRKGGILLPTLLISCYILE